MLLLLVLAIPVVMLFLEIGIAVLFGGRANHGVSGEFARARIAVLVPAHNEGQGILPTLKDLLGQLEPSDRCLVVADNCDDDTAELARVAGAEVIERHDLERRGKGFALDFGIKHLRADPPNVVIMVDADCRVPDGTVLGLTHCVQQSRRPCQARSIHDPPSEPLVRHRIAAFAYIVKTYVRPLGLKLMGGPCGLMGTGMAFPWALIGQRNLATGHIAEDALIGLQLAAEGHGALFCPQVHVRSTFPTADASMDSQSKRWEHGSLQVLRHIVPGLLGKSIRSLDWRLMLLALDATVPPLTALILVIGACCAVTTIPAMLGSWNLLLGSFSLLTVLVISLGIAWSCYGRDTLHVGDIMKLPFYVVRKLPIYFGLLRGRASSWTRADRD
ncbi:MAG: glycosyltransferase family 2 protein [Anderseniella sp.]